MISDSAIIKDEGILPYLGDQFHDRPRQNGMATVIRRNSDVDDLDDCFNPFMDFLEYMSEYDLFTVLVAIKCPTLIDTILLSAFCGFLNLVEKGHISRVEMESSSGNKHCTAHIRYSKFLAYSSRDYHIASYPHR